MYNLRYHIASLVGVFLALALGLVLGGLVVQRGTFTSQQEALVSGLRKEFADLRATNDDLKSQNALLGSYADEMTANWVTDRLVGRTYGVVSNIGRTQGVTEVNAYIESAGAKGVSIAVLKPGAGLSDDATRSRVASAAGLPESATLDEIGAALAAEWLQPLQTRPLTTSLVDAGVISVDGLEPGVALAGIVNMAIAGEDADPLALAITKAAVTQGKDKGVAAQMIDTKSKLAQTAYAEGVSSFDTVGTSVGQYTLVALLIGAEPGRYGTGDGVTAEFPPIPAR